MRTLTPKKTNKKQHNTPPRKPRGRNGSAYSGDGDGLGFCPICGETGIPRGHKLAKHMEEHDLTVSEIDEVGDEFSDALDRLEPGIPLYAAVLRKSYRQAKQVNELYRLMGKPDKRKEKPREESNVYYADGRLMVRDIHIPTKVRTTKVRTATNTNTATKRLT